MIFKKNIYVCVVCVHVCMLICMWAHVLGSAQAWYWCLPWLLPTLLRLGFLVKGDLTNLPTLANQIAPEISWPCFPSAGITGRPLCPPGIFRWVQGHLNSRFYTFKQLIPQAIFPVRIFWYLKKKVTFVGLYPIKLPTGSVQIHMY